MTIYDIAVSDDPLGYIQQVNKLARQGWQIMPETVKATNADTRGSNDDTRRNLFFAMFCKDVEQGETQ